MVSETFELWCLLCGGLISPSATSMHVYCRKCEPEAYRAAMIRASRRRPRFKVRVKRAA